MIAVLIAAAAAFADAQQPHHRREQQPPADTLSTTSPFSEGRRLQGTRCDCAALRGVMRQRLTACCSLRRYDYAAIQPRTTALDADVVEGFTTFQLSLSAADGSDAQQVYAIFGDDADPLSLPAAYHVRLRGLCADEAVSD